MLLWIIYRLTVVRIVIVIFDHFITIDQEVDTLWKKKQSLASVALLVNRYAILLLGLSYALVVLASDNAQLVCL